MLAANGRHRVFIDVDLDYPPPEIGKVLARLEAGADVAIASRMASGSVLVMHPWHIQYLFTRHVASRMLNKVFRSFYVRGVLDSQAGLKGFTARAAEAIFPRTTIDRFSSDMEVLYIAHRLGLRIEQVPVNFAYGRQPSTVRFFRDGIYVVRDLIRIRVNGARGLYDGMCGRSRDGLGRLAPR
jgi:dolichyl-phosphate beta-glucosyltransferase